MRDLVLLAFLAAALYFVFRRPFIGVMLSSWAALFAPQGWVFGFGIDLRINLIITLVTMLSYLISKNKASFQLTGLSVLMFVYFFWVTMSSVLTISDPTPVWKEWDVFWKTMLLYFFVLLMVDSKHRITMLLWALVLSASFVGAYEGLKFIVSAGGHNITGPMMGKLEDRNNFAMALNVMLPIMIFLHKHTPEKLFKTALKVGIFLNVVAILGTLSRGGALALAVVAGYYFMKSDRKLAFGMLALVGVLGLQLMPERFHDRMDTMGSVEYDESFLGRVQAWKQAVLLANDHPFFGGGFKAGQYQPVWDYYRPRFGIFDNIIETSHVKFPKPKAAHSVYFQIMGDHGYAGLLIFLMILYGSFRQTRYVEKRGYDPWMRELAVILRVSLVAYAFAGAALSVAYFDLAFVLFGLIAVLYRLTVMENAEQPVAEAWA